MESRRFRVLRKGGWEKRALRTRKNPQCLAEQAYLLDACFNRQLKFALKLRKRCNHIPQVEGLDSFTEREAFTAAVHNEPAGGFQVFTC